jgi:hypothetical protein
MSEDVLLRVRTMATTVTLLQWALWALSAVVPSACTCERGPSAVDVSRDFGALGAPVPDVAPHLAMARAIIDKRGRAAVPEPQAAPGRRVMLVFWPPPGAGESSVATANGATMGDAVAAAAEALAPSVRDASTGRFEIDVPTGIAPRWDARETSPLVSMGLEGMLVARDDGRVGFVLPSEVLEKHLARSGSVTSLDSARVEHWLAQRAGVSPSALSEMRGYGFRADTFIESSDRVRVLKVVRGQVVGPPDVTPETLLAAARRGAEYLARMLSGSGRYAYMVHPQDERPDSSYGWLRHGGATYALLEAYEEFGDPRYVEKARLALQYLGAHLKPDLSSQGSYIIDTTDEEQQKTGGAGLSLVAYAKHASVTGSRADEETMRALARFILKQQYEDGHFRCNADLEQEAGTKLKREPVYYAGEALLGLMRLYAIDPQPSYLAAARRGADWIVNVRDRFVSEDKQEHDHWAVYAFNELYRVTRDEAYLQHAYKIARAIQRKQHAGDAWAPDLIGTFYEAQTTPASTRLEAYAADIALARFAGKPDTWLMDSARPVAHALLGAQFTLENAYWLKNPARIEGGMPESPFIADVRIDYVQHAMSAWLHLARLLRDPHYGAEGVPSQIDEGGAPRPPSSSPDAVH